MVTILFMNDDIMDFNICLWLQKETVSVHYCINLLAVEIFTRITMIIVLLYIIYTIVQYNAKFAYFVYLPFCVCFGMYNFLNCLQTPCCLGHPAILLDSSVL